MKSPAIVTSCLLLVCLAAGGCSSQQMTADDASFGVVSGAPAVTTLGAGDSLGWCIYANDLILAARADRAPIRRVGIVDAAE